MHIEQAIFTSATTSAGDGYRLVANSPGVTAEDAHELTVWGPSHDSLCDHSTTASSINFQRLQSGNFCVSKTANAGSEYSRRQGPRVYTQFLVVNSDTFARFANNPFALIRAATAQGRMQPLEQVPRKLEPLRLAGKSVAVDHSVISELLVNPGLSALTAFIDAALQSERLVLVAPRDRQQWIAGLFNCLPIDCRTQFTFTTGLKPSPRRPFRISSIPEATAESRRLRRDEGVTIFDVNALPTTPPTTPWARFLAIELADGKSSRLAGKLDLVRAGNGPAALDLLAEHFQQRAESLDGGEPLLAFPRLARVSSTDSAAAAADQAVAIPVAKQRVASERLSTTVKHERLLKARNNLMNTSAAVIPSLQSSWNPLGSQSAGAIEALEHLDDTVFEAMAGDRDALASLKLVWPETLAKLGPAQLAESREHYIRRALATWRQYGENSANSDPERAVSAIEVICALFGE